MPEDTIIQRLSAKEADARAVPDGGDHDTEELEHLRDLRDLVGEFLSEHERIEQMALDLEDRIHTGRCQDWGDALPLLEAIRGSDGNHAAQAIFLEGNLSEGFIAYGPYQDISEALHSHGTDEGWGMTLEPTR